MGVPVDNLVGNVMGQFGISPEQLEGAEDDINAMLAEHEEGYGYLWWIYPKDTTIKIIRKEYNTGKYDSYCANGVGGSLVAVIPELDAVISMVCSLVYNPKPRMELINNYITPYLESLKE